MIPYTIDAVTAIRHAAAARTPISELQQHLGWDNAMLTRVCAKHGIELVTYSVLPASVLPSQEPIRESLPPIAPYPPWVARILGELTPLQARIFHILRRRGSDGTQWVKGADIADALGRATDQAGVRSVSQAMGRIARRIDLMRAGYRIEAQTGPDGGYRLVIDKAAR